MTTDNYTYHIRTDTSKSDFICDYVRDNEYESVLDVGCNNGVISAPLLKDGVKVFGIDASSQVKPVIPFERKDILEDGVRYADCTLFLSLYHHLLGKYGIDVADTVFYQLLLRSETLIFDTGNVSEKDRKTNEWYLAQDFQSENELLDHFGLPYEEIGSWETGGGKRTVVVFKRSEFDHSVEVVEEYKRKIGNEHQNKGLIPKIRWNGDEFQETLFYKLRLNEFTFFAKKHLREDYAEREKKNITRAFNAIPHEKLLTFYGISESFGLIWEWVEFEYVEAANTTIIYNDVNSVSFNDTDIIHVDGKEKVIDFLNL